MAAPPLLKTLPLLRLRIRLCLHHHNFLTSAIFPPLRLPFCTSASSGSTWSEENVLSSASELLRVKEPPKFFDRFDDPSYRKWKDKEDEILRDIEPITLLAKDILHSDRYMDGERLAPDEEKTVIERLLAYHPHSVDKIGCGLDSIMVDRHPQFRQSRCLFVVRTDGGWIDFSYQKCIREYIRKKYPSYAERFIREHFKRSSG
ncbi:protein DCL, chloroplastic isoform X2 [Amaranthus tricolor]|uniref:protein DCL, chloroplastic isoform X2 n=1 Tax=Amaranthus tricolor TaxID=29722 RepID=UPI00258DB42E|nr:protein DCL, chloroplastic isoform X2 [Amaranthus tricolor]